MKTIVVLLFSLVLFNNCGGTDDGDNSFDADVSEDADNPVCGDGVCEAEEIGHYCMVDCEGDTDSPDGADVAGDIADCPVGCECCADYDDCACFKWPQTVEYMWLVGTWKCVEMGTGGSCDFVVDVEITAWDEELGAETQAFPPYGPPTPYLRFKQNPNTGQFEAIYQETMQVVGSGDPIVLRVTLLASAVAAQQLIWEKVE